MANDVTYTAQSSTNSYISMYLYVIESSYDTASNTSLVQWEVGLRKSSASTAATQGTFTWTVSVNGAGGSGSVSASVAPGGQVKLASGETTAAHDADGTKSIRCDAVIGGKETVQLGARTFALTAIPRASSMTVAGSTLGSPVTFSISAASSAFAHSITWAFGNQTSTCLNLAGAGSHSWTPPLSLASEIPNAASGTMTFTLYTFTGTNTGVCVGTKTYQVSLGLPPSVRPGQSEAGWAAISYDNSGTLAAGIGAAVQGYSKAVVTFDNSKVTYPYGASLQSFSITYNGSTRTRTSAGALSTAVITASGTVQVTVKVTDSRGRSMTETRSLTVWPYARPSLSEVSIFRATESGEASEAGSMLCFRATAAVSSIKPGDTELNPTATFVGRYRPAAGTAWTETPTLVSGAATVYAAGLDLTVTYQAMIVLTDTMGNSTAYTVTLPTGDVAFHIRDGGKGAAFGKYAETDDLLEVDWAMKVNGDIQATGAANVAEVTAGYAEIQGNTNISGQLGVGNGIALSGGLYVGSSETDALTDYIVAKGTSGSWRYWKWNSGLAVCIHSAVTGSGDGNFNNNQNTATWGGWYDLPEYTFSAYPFSFAEIPAVYASRTSAHSADYNSNFVFIAMTGGSTTSPPAFDIARPTFKAIGGPQLSITVIGRWK